MPCQGTKDTLFIKKQTLSWDDALVGKVPRTHCL